MNLALSLLAGAMALGLGVPAAAQDSGSAAPRMETTAGLNLRAGPSLQHDRISVIPEGAAVAVNQCSSGWCEIEYSGSSGFVSAKYLAALSDQTAGADEWRFMTTSDLDLRSGPGMEHGTVGTVPEGTSVAVEQCLPGWCEVTYEETTGYLQIVAGPPQE